jgi:hypothetical protein
MKTAEQTAASSAPSERRVDYRLQYPSALSPVLEIEAEERQVLDISEYGIRFAASGKNPNAGQRFSATVRFRNAPTQTVSGSFVRIGDDEIAAQLDNGIDFHVIVREHDWVMKHLP